MERIKIEGDEKMAEIETVLGYQNIEEKNEKKDTQKIAEIRQKIDELKNKPKKSSIHRIAGKATEEKKLEILNKAGEIFANQKVSSAEREKTPIELEILSLVDQATNEILQKYGLPDFNIPPENVHIRFDKEWEKTKQAGIYNPGKQHAVLQDKKRTRTRFALQSFHEKLHFKSYNSRQMDTEGSTTGYRLGLTIKTRDEEKVLFRNLNEAITEAMTKKYGTKLLDNPLFEDEQVKTKALKARYGNDPVFGDVYFMEKADHHPILNLIRRFLHKPEQKDTYYESFVYEKERQTLDTLIKKLLAKNPEKFKSEEEIMEMFERAMMTGHIHAVGQLIDKTFPKKKYERPRRKRNVSEDWGVGGRYKGARGICGYFVRKIIFNLRIFNFQFCNFQTQTKSSGLKIII